MNGWQYVAELLLRREPGSIHTFSSSMIFDCLHVLKRKVDLNRVGHFRLCRCNLCAKGKVACQFYIHLVFNVCST